MSSLDKEKGVLSEDSQHTPYVGYHLDEEFDFKIGMVFESEDEAYETYNLFALRKGFGVRKNKSYYNRANELRTRSFVCSRQGFTPDIGPHEQRNHLRVGTRCGCNASIKFKITDGLWEVVEYIAEHNHELIKEGQKHLIRSGRKITESSEGVLKSMSKAGIRTKNVYSYLANEAGGVQNVGFTLRDCHNFIQTQRSNMISAGDAQSLINYFKSMQASDSMFFYTMQVDEENRMTNFFWRDGLSKVDYDCFGDVVIFDTTYRTNKYNMICAPFVGVNHHWKNVFFGCAFLLDETTTSFVWLFETFLESMGNKAPKTIFTDQDHAMANAIAKVFPNAQHRLCEWHIAKNAAQNIPHLYGKSEFRDKYFSKLLYGCESESEFEITWQKMTNEWNTGSNTWLNKLYDLRSKWCPAFSLDVFSAGIRSTQRSESKKNIFQQMACKSMTLTEFVNHYQANVIRMREAEVEEDFNCARGKLKMHARNNELLKDAASMYTHRIFRMFEDEFLQSISEHVVNVLNDGSMLIYTLQTKCDKRQHIVHFNSLDYNIDCSCKLFESKGWLCRHALCILNMNINIRKISSQYILKRWTKDVKKDVLYGNYAPIAERGASSSKICRLNMMMRKAFNILSLSADSDETTQSACKKLDEIAEDVIKHKASIVVNEDANVCTTNSNNDAASLDNQMHILDPLQRRPKGVSNTRLKGALEKRKKRAPKKTMQTFHQQLVATSAAPSDFSTFSQQLPISQYQSFQMGSNQEFSFMNLLSQRSSNDYQEYRNLNSAQLQNLSHASTTSGEVPYYFPTNSGSGSAGFNN